MERLPTEIKHKILNHFLTEVLTEIIAKVCLRWKEIADDIVKSRVEKIASRIQLETLHDIKCRLTPKEAENAVDVLKVYEKSYLFTKFKVSSSKIWFKNFSEELKDVGSFILKIEKDRGCDCTTGIAQCLCRALRIMNCYKLIVVQIPEKIQFYNMTDPWKKIPIGENSTNVWKPYTTLQDFVRVDNNTHAALSVYQDRIIAQETSRVLILFRVTDVNHVDRTVTLEKLRRLFLPLWSCAIMLYKTKVYAVYTTGSIGVWDQRNDDLQTSNNKCGDEQSVKTMRLTMMYRCNNLIFVTLSSSAVRMGTCWSIMDANDDTASPTTISMTELINETFPLEDEDCKSVVQINMLNNALFVHCKVGATAETIESKIFIARMKRDPCLQDFTCAKNFSELLCTPKSDSMIKYICFDGGLLTPIYPPFLTPDILQPPLGGQVDVYSLFGIQRYKNIKHRQNKLRLVFVSVLNY